MQDKLLTTLIDKFDASSLSELEFSDGTARIVLRKGGGVAGAEPPQRR